MKIEALAQKEDRPKSYSSCTPARVALVGPKVVSENSGDPGSENAKEFLQFVFGGFLVWVAVGVDPLLYFNDLAKSGTFGDTFGAANALISSIAMAGVVYAIVLQRRELALQRKEMELSRKELAAQNHLIAQQLSTMRGSVEHERLREALQSKPLFVKANGCKRTANGTLCRFRNGGGRITDLSVTSKQPSARQSLRTARS